MPSRPSSPNCLAELADRKVADLEPFGDMRDDVFGAELPTVSRTAISSLDSEASSPRGSFRSKAGLEKDDAFVLIAISLPRQGMKQAR